MRDFFLCKVTIAWERTRVPVTFLDDMVIKQVSRTARDVVDQVWGTAAQASSGGLEKMWDAAVAQGWWELGAADALDAALAVTGATGRAACPLPAMDGFVAVRILASRPDLVADIADGSVRVVVTTSGSGELVRFAEAGTAASHVLIMPAGGGRASLHPIEAVDPLPGLAVPLWANLRLSTSMASVEMDAELADDAIVLLRLGLAVRALAAARRTHELAVEHAKARRQFGRAVGSFGAVQQRTATCQIDVTAGDLLVADAVRRYCVGASDWTLAAELATSHVLAIAPRIQLGAHHTLAAVGYFEKHEAPWLFRRVHADVTRLRTLTRSCGEVADILAETDACLPAPDMGPDADRFRGVVRSVLAEWTPAGRVDAGMNDDPDLVAAMSARGWFGMAWPAEAGGIGATLAEELVLQDEVIYHQLPVGRALSAVATIGTPILKHGTAGQKQRYLSLVRQGKLNFCLGYSEPEAGSDLGSLKCCAVRDGAEWVIDGQKLWTTNAHNADYVWLAVRTDPQAAPPHAGISVFIVPMDTPGITVQQHRALSGEISCSVFYAGVRVPDSARVGEVNGGWEVIAEALRGERIVMTGIAAMLHRQLDDLLAVVRGEPDTVIGPRGSAKRARLGGLATTVQATRQLASAVLPGTSGARLATPMAGVLASELAEDFGEAALEILGPQAALATTDVAGGGAFEYGLRRSMTYVIGGGTNDIQRGLIARGLGLPW